MFFRYKTTIKTKRVKIAKLPNAKCFLSIMPYQTAAHHSVRFRKYMKKKILYLRLSMGWKEEEALLRTTLQLGPSYSGALQGLGPCFGPPVFIYRRLRPTPLVQRLITLLISDSPLLSSFGANSTNATMSWSRKVRVIATSMSIISGERAFAAVDVLIFFSFFYSCTSSKVVSGLGQARQFRPRSLYVTL